MKIFILTLIAAGILARGAEAKTALSDSAGVVRAATRDAHRFKLKSNDLKKFVTEHWSPGSDHFKPVAKNGTDLLLNDSLYVSTYRAVAFNNAAHQRNRATRREFTLVSADLNSAAGSGDTTYKGHLARLDVNNFTLSPDMMKRFKKERFPITSDYFSPTNQTTGDARMLKDSTYVKDFREEAFYKTVNDKHHPSKHISSSLIVGSLLGTAAIILLLVEFGMHYRN